MKGRVMMNLDYIGDLVFHFGLFLIVGGLLLGVMELVPIISAYRMMGAGFCQVISGIIIQDKLNRKEESK